MQPVAQLQEVVEERLLALLEALVVVLQQLMVLLGRVPVVVVCLFLLWAVLASRLLWGLVRHLFR